MFAVLLFIPAPWQLLVAENLASLLTSFEEPRITVLTRMHASGHMYDHDKWAPKIRALCNHAKHPNLTFDEASRAQPAFGI